MEIKTLSTHQIYTLGSIFYSAFQMEQPYPIENIGITERGDVVVSYKIYGQLKTDLIKREPEIKNSRQ